MKKLSHVRVNEPPPWQKERLSRWLHEWNIDRQLASGDLSETASTRRTMVARESSPVGRGYGEGPTTSIGDTVEIRAGQIRLFYPGRPVTQSRLLYGAVVGAETADRFLIAPFGRFAEPAFPGEWLTGRSEPSLRVLCLWNARVLPGSLARETWLAGELSESQRTDAEAVWESVQGRAPLPDRLERLVGPPLVHPLDPRWTYRQEERSIMEGLSSSAESRFGSASNVVGIPEAGENLSSELALAAESPVVYGSVSVFRVEGSPLSIRVSPGPAPGQRTMLVVDGQGIASNVLNGSILETPDGTQLGTIVNGKAVVASNALSGALRIAMPDGTRLSIRVPAQ